MKIEDLLSPDLMIMDLKATTQEEAIKEIEDTYNSALETDINYREVDIAKYIEQRIDFITYKNALIEFAATIASEGKPLIFVIDELDRCTPSYAVEVLEKIKTKWICV